MTAVLVIAALALLLYGAGQMVSARRELLHPITAELSPSEKLVGAPDRPFQARIPCALWPPIIAALVAVVGLAAPHLIPTDIALSTHGAAAALTVEGETHTWRWPAARMVRLVPADPSNHEWGIDGSQQLNTTTATEDPQALARLIASPYGAFDQALYDEGGIDGVASVSLNGQAISAAQLTAGIPLPRTATLHLAVTHVEIPVQLAVTGADGTNSIITIDRSGRSVYVSGNNTPSLSWYYPTAVLPHLAPVLGQIGQAALWALALYGLALLIARLLAVPFVARRLPRLSWPRSTLPWNAVTGLAVAGSFLGTLWITCAEYDGMPHIADSTSYVMQARILESGHLFGPVPPDPVAFGLPFFGVINGHWVSQYAPGNAAVIAAGLVFGLPFLGPLCLAAGTVLLVSLTARRLYGLAAGGVAALLAALSPFHLFIAGSYLSHVPDAFFLMLGFYLLLRSDWGRSVPLAALSGACIGAALFCRELSAALWGLPLGVALLGVAVRRVRRGRDRPQGLRPWLGIGAFVGGGLPFLLLYGIYNALATGAPTVSPRNVLNPIDRYGFGPGHGWWVTHTLAAGLINLEQQITGLNLEALGWPVGATFGAAVLLLVVRRARPIDGLVLALVSCVLLSTVGYYANGVVYGPRYVYEALPPLLILIAAGLTALGRRLGEILAARRLEPRAAALAVALVTAVLCVPTVTMVLPRHVAFYSGYTAMSGARVLPMQQLYNSNLKRAVVVVADAATYVNIVGSMTDPRNLFNPDRTAGTVWAQGSNPADYARLRAAFPHRTLYILSLDGSGYHFTRAPREQTTR